MQAQRAPRRVGKETTRPIHQHSITGLCEPCLRIEEVLGHGGVTARVIVGGTLGRGDKMVCEALEDSTAPSA